jgi:hypothetical protein
MDVLQPRISVNKLGEYMEAGPARRRSIVNTQRRPPGEAIVARYADALDALKEYFSSPSDDLFYQRATELRSQKTNTAWAMQDKQLSADALVACADVVELLDLRGVRVVPTGAAVEGQFIHIAGVKVSVRPQFLIVDGDGLGRVRGGIKFSFNKQYPLGDTACEYVATVMRQSLAASHGSSVDPKHCFSVATFTRQVVSAPKAHKARMVAIEAACEEIASRWSSVAEV